MQALILAAGRGSRLGDKANGLPKCLLEVGRRPLVEHQLDALSAAGIGPVAMVLGYAADEIRERVGLKAEYLFNPEFSSTNSLYSFWLARDWVKGGLVVMNSDILFDPRVLDRLLATGGDALAFDFHWCDNGTITIELKGAQTGNKSRDKTMHKDVLESERFPVATFGAQKLKGTVAPSGTSEVTLVGVLNLHGGEHPVEIPAKVTVEGARLAVDGSFEVPFVEWGLKDPSWFVLRVDKLIKVRIKGEGTLGAPAAGVAAAGQ